MQTGHELEWKPGRSVYDGQGGVKVKVCEHEELFSGHTWVIQAGMHGAGND